MQIVIKWLEGVLYSCHFEDDEHVLFGNDISVPVVLNSTTTPTVGSATM